MVEVLTPEIALVEDVVMVGTAMEDAEMKQGDPQPHNRKRTVSYKDSLLILNGGPEESGEEEDWMSRQKREDREDEEQERIRCVGEDDPLNPILQINEEVYQEACLKWRNTLIVKLMGKKVSPRVLWPRIHRAWGLSGQYKWINLDNGYFVVRFAEEKDYKRVLEDGPWIILDHYLTVQKWKPMFNAYDDSVHKMTV